MEHVPNSQPYPWPYRDDDEKDDDDCERRHASSFSSSSSRFLKNTCLILIDMQEDFCGKDGYVSKMGYDVALTRKPIPHLKKVLESARNANILVVHTREGHRQTLRDLPKNKRYRSRLAGAEIGRKGPLGKILTRGEKGWNIIDDLKPREGEDVIDKPGKGSFMGTDLDLILRTNKIERIILGGITTDVCVHTTMREANDLGYECLLLEDGTGATDEGNHRSAIKMVHMQNGVFGATAKCEDVCAFLNGNRFDRAWNGGSVDVAIPSALPFPFTIRASKTAIVMIDWQLDFTAPNGFGASLGNNCENLREALPNALKILQAGREAKCAIVHTLEAHKPDLSDCPPAKRRRCNKIGEIVDKSMGRVLICDEPGNAIEPLVAPLEGELIVHKPGKGAFYGTDLERLLKTNSIETLIFTGVTTEVCVQTSMREANDRGFECLLVDDATASYFPDFKEATLNMITSQHGIVGWRATTEDVVEALGGMLAPK